ncbi:hypothetical protein AGOR_G00236060 [Albula goreensis]|uniref:Protein atonal homolog 8 n=1 Tax=Albula goreensis TaxID=1534307 RepID=A0A8T3CK18_9TELE|nr:hypothetical protein AGOR_G00236060 [Albula goreensis]
MKNTQLASEGNWKTLYGKEMTGIKKFKRKSRDPVKHVSGPKIFTHDPDMDEDSTRDVFEETNRSKSLERLHDRTSDLDRIAHPRRNSNTAIDMRINSLSTVTGHLAASLSQPSSPAPAKDTFRNASPQVTSFDHQQPFAPDRPYQSRIVLCQRSSERSFSSIPQASYINNSDQAASPRKRLGETSGVVTEIKAIQQTRRLLANARERTRVHTISAAFEALRKQVPCYSYGQKLSKLAILRIACNYILSLAQLAELDYTPDHSNVSFAECVEQCTRTLQAEGRSKKRKE